MSSSPSDTEETFFIFPEHARYGRMPGHYTGEYLDSTELPQVPERFHVQLKQYHEPLRLFNYTGCSLESLLTTALTAHLW